VAAAPLPLAICLVTWNHWADTAECLASLKAADFDPPLEIWVVDNHSADDTVVRIRDEFPDIRLLENAWNAGFAVAMNQALGAVLAATPADQDRLILLLNNDTLLDPTCLTHLTAGLESQHSAGIAAPTIYYHASPEQLWYAGGGLDSVRCRAWHEGLRTVAAPSGPPTPTGYATGCALLVRASVLRQVGLLDEGYFMYWEDADLCCRARAAGWEVLWIPEARLWHKVSTSTGGNLAPRKLWRKFVSGWRFWSRWHERSLWPLAYLRTSWQDFRRARQAAAG